MAGQVDTLAGLKENVIMGRLIAAGTDLYYWSMPVYTFSIYVQRARPGVRLIKAA
ncbi:MAG: hypothetical protein LBT86_03505 [Deltaproteobacteria bacterium]|nr:hypothetical protein [Deltaproteobacteria bacterium]